MTESTEKTSSDEQTGLGEPSQWPELLDALLRGIGHSLSNRIGALIGLAEIDRTEATPAVREQLSREIERLLELNRLLRLLPGDANPRAEALLPADVLTDAFAIMALHSHAGEVSWETVAENSQPVRVPRSILLRALLLLLDAARREAQSAGTNVVTVLLRGDDAHLAITTHVAGARHSPDPMPALAVLVERAGGRFVQNRGEAPEIHLPTLTAIRRRREGGPDGLRR